MEKGSGGQTGSEGPGVPHSSVFLQNLNTAYRLCYAISRGTCKVPSALQRAKAWSPAARSGSELLLSGGAEQGHRLHQASPRPRCPPLALIPQAPRSLGGNNTTCR